MSYDHDEVVVSAAVRTVARAAVGRTLKIHPPDHEDFPDIGEHDWERVRAVVDRTADLYEGQAEKYAAAYRFLAQRADGGVS